MVSLFLMSRGVRLLESVIPEQFVSKTRTQVQSIGSAMLIPLLIHADDKSLSHKSLNSWPVQYLGKMSVLAIPSPWPAVAVGLVYDATLCMGSDGVRISCKTQADGKSFTHCGSVCRLGVGSDPGPLGSGCVSCGK
jgi:hypothetical protein